MVNRITNKLHRYLETKSIYSEEDISCAWLGWDAWVGIAQDSSTLIEHTDPCRHEN